MFRRTHMAQARNIRAAYLYQDHEHNIQAGPNFHLRPVHPKAQLRRGRQGTHKHHLLSAIHVHTTGTPKPGWVQRHYR